MTDLILKHQFTDRGGREVYNMHHVTPGPSGVPDNGIYEHEERIVGQVRLPPIGSSLIPIVDWAKGAGDDDST